MPLTTKPQSFHFRPHHIQSPNHFPFIKKKDGEEADLAAVDTHLRDSIKEEMRKRVSELSVQWDELQDTTKLKGEKLFDANRGILFEQSVDSIDIWIKEMERHIQFTCQKPGSAGGEHGGSAATMDLTTTNLLLDKQREIEAQIQARQRQVCNVSK